MLKNRIIYNNYSPWIFSVSRAKNSHIWDAKGKKLIDFTSGWNVTNLGWNNDEVTAATIRQAKKNHFSPMWLSDPIQEELAEKLTKLLPKGLNFVGKATGGTEANEEALKTARVFTGRTKVIGFRNSFHGQSPKLMSIAYPSKYILEISSPINGFIQMDFPGNYPGDKSGVEILKEFTIKLEKVLSKRDVAAVICEAGIITGWGDVRVAPKGFVKVVRRLTKKYGTLMVLDEVGTGFSRCGKLFAMELEGIVPDIVTLAKGLSNGAAAIGAMVTTREIALLTSEKSKIASTFGWTPLACAASLQVLKIHKRDKVWDLSRAKGDYIRKTLEQELGGNSQVGDIRGMGMEIGLEFVKEGKSKGKNPEMLAKVIKLARKSGLHLVGDYESVLQIMPPLTIEQGVLDNGLEILVKSIRGASMKSKIRS